MYEYKIIEVPIEREKLFPKTGESFKKCEAVIMQEASNGWRLIQVVIPPNEKFGTMSAYAYQIIFEREKSNYE